MGFAGDNRVRRLFRRWLSLVSEMTESATRPGKRERLICAAADLMHTQGVQRTTLAQVAESADVPPGNVYYYFKTFDDLVEAVVDARLEDIRNNLAALERRRTPRSRLKGLAELWNDSAAIVSESGCPIGSLSSELNKFHDRKAAHAVALLRTVIDFVERQFRELGRRDAAGLSVTMVARIQGAALLSNTFGDPDLLSSEVRRIDRWIDELAAES